MNNRIRELAERALREDIFAAAEYMPAAQEYESYPETLRIAYNIRDYFRKIPVRHIDGELLTDGFRTDGLPVAGCAYRHTGHKSFHSFFVPHSDYSPNHLAFTDWNHYCADYRFIVNNGFKGRLKAINEAKEAYKDDTDKLNFIEAVETVCYAVKELGERYGQRVPFEPAGSFAEAVESVWITFLLMPDSVGRLDSVLHPFYKRDIAGGSLTKELAEEYIGELLIKVFAHIGYKAHKSGDNTMVVGGYELTSDGLKDGFTELSELILRVRAELPIWRPQISFRYTALTPPGVMKFVTEMNAKCSDIVFSNDEIFLKAFERLGIDFADAVDYTKIGCNEWSIMGKSNTGSDGFLNVSAALEEVLHFHADEAARCDNFEQFYKFFSGALSQSVTFMCDLADKFYEANSGDMNILSSLIIDGCIQSGRSVTAGGAKYNESCWAAVGIVNLADSLSVIKQFVYEEKTVTMTELCNALHDNWHGHEYLLKKITSKGRFFGNNDDFADSIVNRLIHDLDALANRRKPSKGGRYVFGCYIGYNGAHVSMGLRTRATPDGRHSGDSFTAGIGAGPGRDKNGICAYLSSAAKLDYTDLCAPLAVNLKLDSSLKPESDVLSALFTVYLESGGLQLQPDYISSEILREAQAYPDKWRSLRVRITGFTGFFVMFDRKLQNEIISRTEHGLS